MDKKGIACYLGTIAAALLLCISAFGQTMPLKFQFLNTDNGLSDGTVYDVLKDSRGFLWVATSKGLNRFDGFNTKVYRPVDGDSSSISGDRITSIAEDKDGKIWVGTTKNGISVLDTRTNLFRRYVNDPDNQSSVSSNTINKVYCDKQNQIWVASTSGLDLYNSKTDKFSRKLTNRNITTLSTDGGDGFWINASNGIDHYVPDINQLTSIPFDVTDQAIAVSSIITDQKNETLVGVVGHGIYRLNNNSFDPINNVNTRLTSKIITSIFPDVNGKIWIGTDGGGLAIYDPLKQELKKYINNPYDTESLSSNAVLSVTGDDEGNVWVGTFRYGINHFNPYRKKFTTIKKEIGQENTLSHNSVIAMYPSSSGVWLGTDGGGLNHYNSKTGEFKHYKNNPNNSNSISSNVIKSIYEDNEGNLWLGTYLGGLNKFNPKTGVSTVYKQDLNDNESIGSNLVWAIYEDNRDNLWLGLLNSGLSKLNRSTGKFENFLHDPNNPKSVGSTNVFVMLEDREGNFWVGTEFGGLSLMDRDNKTFRTFKNDPNDPYSIPSDEIRSLFEDNESNLWIGTKKGISLWDNEKKQFYYPEVNNHLNDLIINGILQDDNGNLWLSTEKGIARYNHQSKELVQYDKNDGLQGNQFNYTSSAKLQDGSLCFGGLNGINLFNPKNIRQNSTPPNLEIVSFKLFDTEITPSLKINNRVIIQNSISYEKEITLKHKENVFSIQFAAMDFSSPLRTKYQYRLQGFDEFWLNANAKNREVSYMNLDAGSYTFEVKGTNSDGTWSKETKKLVINIKPAWYDTWWFRTIVILTTLFLITASYLFRKRILNEKRQVEERLRKQRLADLKKVVTFLKTNSQELTVTGNNLKAKSGVLASDAKTQISTAKQIESDIEVVTNHTRKNSENATITNTISESTVKQLEKIKSATAINVKEIEAISNEMSLLEEIFNQTNILSINASIEAARAGAYGGGFNVIASEVRKLAQKSKTTSHQIISSASKGVLETKKVGQLIMDFIPEVQKAAILIKEISLASKDQNDSIENINYSLKEFFKISRKHSEVSDEIHTISARLDDLAKSLNDQVNELEVEI